jgi:hypothetical protein
LRGVVAAQAVGDDASRLVTQPLQQPFEEALGCCGISPVLDQDVEHDAVLVDGTLKVAKLTVDPDEHLVQVPGVFRPGSPPAEPLGKFRSEFSAPASDALVGYDHLTLRQDQLDVPQAQTEHVT